MTERPVGVPRRGLALLILVVIAFVVVTIFAVIKYRDVSHVSHQNSERKQVATIAGQYAIDLSSFDYRKYDAESADSVTHATPDFAKKYLETLKLLRPLFIKGKLVQTTSVARVAVLSLTPSSAKVLVALETSATSINKTDPVAGHDRLEISLSKIDGKWLASDLTRL